MELSPLTMNGLSNLYYFSHGNIIYYGWVNKKNRVLETYIRSQSNNRRSMIFLRWQGNNSLFPFRLIKSIAVCVGSLKTTSTLNRYNFQHHHFVSNYFQRKLEGKKDNLDWNKHECIRKRKELMSDNKFLCIKCLSFKLFELYLQNWCTGLGKLQTAQGKIFLSGSLLVTSWLTISAVCCSFLDASHVDILFSSHPH